MSLYYTPGEDTLTNFCETSKKLQTLPASERVPEELGSLLIWENVLLESDTCSFVLEDFSSLSIRGGCCSENLQAAPDDVSTTGSCLTGDSTLATLSSENPVKTHVHVIFGSPARCTLPNREIAGREQQII